jgi:zinc-RING finger domain
MFQVSITVHTAHPGDSSRTSLPCQHIFCDSCLSKMSGGESISCPQCRRLSDVDNFEPVEFTATQQWDQLLEIAQQFAAMEGQLGPDTSEEEKEENLRENFIDDGDNETRFVAVVVGIRPCSDGLPTLTDWSVTCQNYHVSRQAQSASRVA